MAESSQFAIFVSLIKKYSILTLLLVAYTIVLAHSIIPHHHHDEDHGMEQSNHHQDDDHDAGHGNDDSGLAHDFANYIHSGNTGDVYQQPDIKISCNSIAIVSIFAIFDFRIKAIENPQPLIRPYCDYIPIVHHCLSSKGFRAPPSTLA